jgi:hypothetical protein
MKGFRARLGLDTIGCAASKLALWSSMLGRREKRNKEKIDRRIEQQPTHGEIDMYQNTIKNGFGGGIIKDLHCMII